MMKLHDFWFMSLETCLGMIMCCCCCVWCDDISDFGTFHKNGFCVSFEEIKWFWWISWLLIMWNKLWIMYVWLGVCCLRVWIVFVRIGSKMGVEIGVFVKKMKNRVLLFLPCRHGRAPSWHDRACLGIFVLCQFFWHDRASFEHDRANFQTL